MSERTFRFTTDPGVAIDFEISTGVVGRAGHGWITLGDTTLTLLEGEGNKLIDIFLGLGAEETTT